MVECQLPKLNTRVRFPSSAPKGMAVSNRKLPFLYKFGSLMVYYMGNYRERI